MNQEEMENTIQSFRHATYHTFLIQHVQARVSVIACLSHSGLIPPSLIASNTNQENPFCCQYSVATHLKISNFRRFQENLGNFRAKIQENNANPVEIIQINANQKLTQIVFIVQAFSGEVCDCTRMCPHMHKSVQTCDKSHAQIKLDYLFLLHNCLCLIKICGSIIHA